MRSFIVFSLLLTVGFAAPQYGYEPLSSGGGISGLQNGAQAGQGRGGDKYLPPESPSEAPIINKQFYLISAPEDNNNEGKVKRLVLGRPQKNYRVLFIKAPAPDNDNLKYAAEFAPQEEKTVIYVLHKKGEDIDAGNIATPAPSQPSKPEVFFIKYKTDDEAQQVQKEIQGEYDKLGGTNEFSEEKSPPVTSVVGSLDGLNPDGSYNYHQINNNHNNNHNNNNGANNANHGNNGGNSGSGNSIDSAIPSTQYLPSFFKQ